MNAVFIFFDELLIISDGIQSEHAVKTVGFFHLEVCVRGRGLVRFSYICMR